MIAEMQSQNRVIAYVDEALSEDEARALESKVSKVANIETCEFVTREEAMTSFESDYDADLFENIDSSVFRFKAVEVCVEVCKFVIFVHVHDYQSAVAELHKRTDIELFAGPHA